MLKVVENSDKHYVVLLDTQELKRLNEFASKRRLNRVQAIRLMVGVALKNDCIAVSRLLLYT